MGLPVVCSDAGGLGENVEHGVTGPGGATPRRGGAGRAADAACLPTRAARRPWAQPPATGPQRALRHRPPARRAGSALPRTLSRPALQCRLGEDAPRTPDRELRASSGAGRSAAQRAGDARCVAAVAHGVPRGHQQAVPPARAVLVVSRGDERDRRLRSHRGGTSPRPRAAVYAGHHPADSAELRSPTFDELCDAGRGLPGDPRHRRRGGWSTTRASRPPRAALRGAGGGPRGSRVSIGYDAEPAASAVAA